MTLTELLKKRRSVRRFEHKRVPREVLEGLLKATLTAPSSKNTRSTRFMVIEDAQILTKVAQMRDFGSALLADAPCAILVCGDSSATDLWLDNAAISATILQLVAEEAGLGSCWVHVNGRPRWSKERNSGSELSYAENSDAETATDYLRKFLPLPKEWNPLCAVALGYPLEPSKPRSEKDDADKVIYL